MKKNEETEEKERSKFIIKRERDRTKFLLLLKEKKELHSEKQVLQKEQKPQSSDCAHFAF